MIFALGLLAWFIASGLYGYWRGGALYWAGQACIATGAAINIFHFYRLKHEAGSLCRPSKLVTTGGMLTTIRHPMYLGELIVIIGFCLTIASPLAVIPGACYLWFISLLCEDEDLNNAEAFPEDYPAWHARTKRLLPGLW